MFLPMKILAIQLYILLIHCTSNKNQHALMVFTEDAVWRSSWTEDAVWRNRFPLNTINAC